MVSYSFHGTGCPRCKESKGERIIESILINSKVNYVRLYFILNPFGNNKNIYVDFYLPDYNTFIEYNGELHYVPIEYFGGKLRFKTLVERDNQLRVYCKENNINLLEIRYDENIEKSINDYFNKIIDKKHSI